MYNNRTREIPVPVKQPLLFLTLPPSYAIYFRRFQINEILVSKKSE